MTLVAFIDTLKKDPKSVSFQEVIAIIDTHYNFEPSAFTNGAIKNKAGENSGSCKVFSFAKLHQLNKEETLSCFGKYYIDVLQTPEGNDHQNIRNFIKSGWEGISFENEALIKK
ncbi:HopJ type III effector protein [Aquimarina aquimarini]|uniref:HopJ type III effector protein n=1 Tax=Aquimarina aquimarini TaxID=1191734 RepID=UPI000D559FAA|nr:HopJ type III effector protein [Aquimarina aquimarini]